MDYITCGGEKKISSQTAKIHIDKIRDGVKKYGMAVAELCVTRAIDMQWPTVDFDKLADDFNGQDKHQEKIVPSAHYIEN